MKNPRSQRDDGRYRQSLLPADREISRLRARPPLSGRRIGRRQRLPFLGRQPHVFGVRLQQETQVALAQRKISLVDMAQLPVVAAAKNEASRLVYEAYRIDLGAFCPFGTMVVYLRPFMRS